MKRDKEGSHDKNCPNHILSDKHILPLWTRLGTPESGPKGILLVSRTKSVNDMTTFELASDLRELLMVLAQRAKQKRDGDAIKALVVATKTINLFLESLENTHEELFAFAPQHTEWPVNLSPKQQIVDAVVARLERLKVGTESIPTTKRGTHIDPKNWATQIATELIRRLNTIRSYQLAVRARRREKNAGPIPPIDAELMRSWLEELGPIPKTCAKLGRLPPFGSTTWKAWWPCAKAALDALWKQHPVVYDECLNRNSVAEEVKNAPESVRRNYAKRHIKQAFASIAKNLGKGS